ncbi:Outer membrane protein Imp, required for envelope biogenesis [Lutibaculum baratangense AMV1]|uniref:LPS-assembly protein LptD n=2 Tax=Lutibaculum TaxID=1358438 RepID=V4RMG6_9HYPH|nr:Outer membrane protein Imp, required for envelope biogenesis [Lutibaculum baratangense AMV1]
MAGSVLACLACAPALAQWEEDPAPAPATPFDLVTQSDPEARMLLEAEELVYDLDNDRVSAVGAVEIYYREYAIEAPEVIYDQRTQRVVARGGVKVTEPDGNVLYADHIELTDDFRQGFLQELTLVTPERARFAAANAERIDDNITIFNRGVYTACEPCREQPDKAPVWQLKAARIIHDQDEKVVRYEDASFEFLGVPVAYLPFFSHPDPTVTRKSGFLRPDIRYASDVGFSVGIPYFFNLAPNYDLTVTGAAFSNQGLLADVEWRHRLVNGSYSIRAAGINQMNPDDFESVQSNRDWRGALQAQGAFNINEFWQWGFQGHLISDSKFLDDYYFDSDTQLRDTLFLTGMSARNYFDARIINYQVLREYDESTSVTPAEFYAASDTYGHSNYFDHPNNELPVVHPVVDYNYILDRPVLGGRVSFDANFLSLSRADADFVAADGSGCPLYGLETGNFSTDPNALTAENLEDCTLLGVPGDMTRLVAQASWERSLVTPAGQIITPFASLRGDAYAIDVEDPYLGTAGFPVVGQFINTGEDQLVRGMATLGLEGRWPILVTAGWGYQVFEPVAQLVARPDAEDNSLIPNEDAISLVFDDTNLFSRDKFSGYDRLEGGTRLNAGVRYKMQANAGFSASALFGQSYHLAGENPFPLGSGLETDRSDYVAAAYVSPIDSLEIGSRVRLDEDDFQVMRQDFQVRGTVGPVSGIGIYTSISADPTRNVLYDRREVQGLGSLQLNDEWKVFGGARYELEGPNDSQWIAQSIGIGYEDECIAFAIQYEQTFVRDGNIEPDERITFSLSLRTLTETRLSASLDGS